MKKLFLIGLFSMLLVSPAIAADETYQAEVAVDVSADNSALAKQSAMSLANTKGFITVVKRIATDDDVKTFEALKPEQIANFIKEVDVIDENFTNTRYIASFNVKINEDLLKNYMQEKHMTIIQDTPQNVLIIPIIRHSANTEPLLFTDDNIWLNTWNNKKVKDGTITFYTIKANPMLDVHGILSSNSATFDTIIKDNGIKDIHILEAYPDNNSFIVILTSYTTGLKSRFNINMADNNNYLNDALNESVSRIADFVKKQRLNQAQSSNQIIVLYHYPSLKDWVDIEHILKSSDYTRNLDVDAFGNGKVQFKIEYIGTIDDLQKYLRQSNLSLEERQENIYILKRI